MKLIPQHSLSILEVILMCGNNFSNKSFYINNGSIYSKGMYDGNLSIFTFDQTHKFEAVGEKAEIPSSAILLMIN